MLVRMHDASRTTLACKLKADGLTPCTSPTSKFEPSRENHECGNFHAVANWGLRQGCSLTRLLPRERANERPNASCAC